MNHHRWAPLAAACLIAFVGVGTAGAEKDHLTGYKVRDLDRVRPGGSYELVDDGATITCEPRKASFLFVPSEKDGGDDERGGEAVRYICYKSKCAGTLPPDAQANDQFGDHTIQAKGARFLCAPVEQECVGEVVGGSCWLLGAPGASCDTTCSDASLLNDVATQIYAGSDGTDGNCVAVLDALQVPGSAVSAVGCVSGLGCASDASGAGRLRCTNTTNSSAAFGTIERACACKRPEI